MEFARDILAGRKHLLESSKVRWINDAPCYNEISVKYVWSCAKKNELIMKFFPNFNGKRIPTKSYLFNVCNTVQPNSIVKLIYEH